jgi:transcriptional regulator with XRE-family HTH domain
MTTTEKIFKLMEENNVKAAQLANELGLTKSNFTQWGQGLQKPSTEAIVKIAQYFKVTTDYLLGLTEKRGDITMNSVINWGVEFYRAFIEILLEVENRKSLESLITACNLNPEHVKHWQLKRFENWNVKPTRKDVENIAHRAKYTVSINEYMINELLYCYDKMKEEPKLYAVIDGKDEMNLINNIRSFNDEGHELIVEQIDTMIASGKYKKSDSMGVGEEKA